MREFALLKVHGSEYEIGFQVGEALKDRISRTIDQIFDYELNTFFKLLTTGTKTPEMPALSTKDILAKTRVFLPPLREVLPGNGRGIRAIHD